ncbi:hypothetical protein [Escherichia coli]|uniref:hypothetical protein n=1 Tax=Escherichia coli TaxID=562 RepID=UPI001FCE9FCC|nr:hypothetical protein [Escherichia coli]
MTTHTSASLPEWLDMLADEFGLTFANIPQKSLTALWTKVRKIHEEWLQSTNNM